MNRAGGLPPWPRDPEAALSPYRAAAGHGPWDRRTAAHLLRRAVGEPPPAQVDEFASLDPAQSLEALFRPADPKRSELAARLGATVAATGDRQQLAGWWLMKLVQERRAPGARLTLFWHDHFACALSKVQDLPALFRQHQTFVQQGEGPFETLLTVVARDPAMLRFLDGDTNRRGVPNENLAREVFELFSLGVGHYTERDIKEAARALTGRTVRGGAYAFQAEYHDPGPKKVLGTEVGDGDEVCRAAAAQPACPRFLIRKLWAFYVSPEAPEDFVELLAERWRQHRLEAGWLIRTLLASRAFYSRQAYRSLVKSPVEFVCGVMRTLGARPDFARLARAAGSMGQDLFEPPGVQGWKDGDAWIHSAAWLARTNFAAAVSQGRNDWIRGVDTEGLFPPATRSSPQAALDRLLEVFLQSELPRARRSALQAALEAAGAQAETTFRTAAHAVLCLPEYHLA